MAPKPKVLLQDWIPLDIEESRQLCELMVAHGVSREVARNAVGRLQTMPDAPLGPSDYVERSRLRALFDTLGEPPWDRASKLRPLSSGRRAA